MRKLFLTLTLFTAIAAQASFSGGVEALYWKPTHAPIPYGFGVPANTVSVQNFNIVGEADWGFRAHLGYECNCLFVEGSYLYFNSKTGTGFDDSGFDTLGIQGLITLIDDEGAVDTVLSERYQNFDVRAGTTFLCNSLYLYGNARWAKINFHNFTTGVAPTETLTLNQAASFNGGGLGVGIGGHANIFCGLGAHAQAGIMGLIGTTGNPTNQYDLDGFDPSLIQQSRTIR